MRRAGAGRCRPLTRRSAPRLLLASIGAALLAGPLAAAEPVAPFTRLVTRVMVDPDLKLDTRSDRISYRTTTPEFLIPRDPARPIDEKDPATFDRVFAEVALTDKEPLALRVEQLGPEDAFSVVLRLPSSTHLVWQIRDVGLKGPGPAASKELVPLFGEDQKAKYKDVVDRINAALDAEAAQGAAK